MEDKRLDLTPRQILLHLLDIEKKDPREEFRIFLPSTTVNCANPDLLLVEDARRMLEFVGLYDYDLDVVYAKTAEGTGGDCQNNGTERAVHIHVSDSYRNNRKASMAVLAHEICHKLLFVKGHIEYIQHEVGINHDNFPSLRYRSVNSTAFFDSCCRRNGASKERAQTFESVNIAFFCFWICKSVLVC